VKGAKYHGKVEAKNIDAAAAILREKKLFIVSLRDHNESAFSELQASMSKVRGDDIVNFTRQLSTMITAGLPLIQALSILEGQAKPAMRKVLRKIIREIEGGSNFGAALNKQNTIFEPVYIALVRAGEAAGALDTILSRLADTLEKQKEFRAKTKGALIYPAIVLTAMLGVVIVMMIFVIPKMTSMYADFGAKLPMVTQILIDVSSFFQNQWYVMLAVTAGTFVLFRSWRKTARGKLQWDAFILKLPLIGPLRHQVLVTEFARTLALMISAGIALLQALDIVIGGVTNEVYRQASQRARSEVEKGTPLSRALEKQGIFPMLLPQMIAVGEETGQLDSVLNKLANYYESESEHTVKNLTVAIEPMIMVVLGLGVGFLIIAIVMPIYNLTNQF
jgi:type IV pilus assembly protein PilC